MRDFIGNVFNGSDKVNQEGWDSVNGGWLPEEEVRKARKTEMSYVKSMKVYDKVPRGESQRVTGKAPIKLRWVDTRKSSGELRSRLVAKEFKRGNDPDMFSATPPLEAMKLMVSMVASAQVDVKDWEDGSCRMELHSRRKRDKRRSGV